MPTIADNSICIRRWDFSETSQVVSHFTREHGVIRGLAKGAKRERGTFSGGMDVLTRGQIVAIVKPGRDLATLTQWTLEEVFWSIRRDLAANRAGLYMADLVHHMLTEHDPHPPLFDALVESLRMLDQPAIIGPAMLRFQWTLLSETGYRPELSSAAVASASGPALFNPRVGGLVEETTDAKQSAAAGPTWRVRRETVELLRNLDSEDSPPDAPPDTIDRANRLLATYIREILGSEVPTMRWAFP